MGPHGPLYQLFFYPSRYSWKACLVWSGAFKSQSGDGFDSDRSENARRHYEEDFMGLDLSCFSGKPKSWSKVQQYGFEASVIVPL